MLNTTVTMSMRLPHIEDLQRRRAIAFVFVVIPPSAILECSSIVNK